MKKRLLTSILTTLVVLFAVPIGAWADDVMILSTTTTSILDFANETVDNSTGLTEITNYNNTGFYLRGNTASGTSIPIRVTNDNRSFNFSDATSVTRKNFAVLKSQTNNNYTSKPLVTAEYSSSNRMNIGFQTAIAGKVYIAFQSSTNPSEGNLFRLAFEGTIVKTASLVEVAKKNNRCDVMEYEATQGGTFFMDGYGKDVSVYYVKFVPETVSNPTLDVSTAGAAIITSGTSTLTGTGNYSITTYYKTSANSEENFTKEDGSWTEGTNVSLNSGGYVYAYSKNTVTGVTSEIVSAQITSNIAQYVLTLGAVSNGTISATVDAAAVSSGTNVDGGKTVTLTATPNTGYQLSGWTDGSNNLGDRPKSLVNTFTMNAATTVNATFEALPTLTGVTEESVWTFDSFAANTLLSDKIVYGYTNATGKTLYINGHNSDGSNQATIKSGNSTVTGISDEVTNYLYFYGSQDSDLKHNRKANAFTNDVASFKTGTAGTVSVYVQGPSGKNINIYEAINTTANSGSTSANKYTTATTGSAQLVTQYVSKNADIFISCSGSPSQIYAVKFAPETVSTPSIAQEGNAVTITAGTSSASSSGATVTTYYTTDGTDPTSSSTAYTEPFDVTAACTVKAITISNGGTSSTVASQQCAFTPTVVNSAVTFESTVTGGSITVKNGDETVASASEIASGTTLTVIVTPSNGYAFGSLSITKTSNSETITPTQDQVDATKYTFTMPTEAVSISATFTIPVWTVNNQANGDITTKTAVDNVYLHQKSGRKSTVADAGTQTLTQFTNGTAHGATKKLTIQGAAEYSSQTGVTTDYISNAMTNRNTADADIDRDFLALDVTEAGILYVIYKPTNNADTRNVYVGFQKASDNSYTKTIQSASIGKVQTEIKHSANGAGTFFIYSSIETEIYAIMFVPETVKTLTTVASPADGGIIKVTNGNATYEGAANGLAVESNTELALVATANTGYNFTGWSDNVTSNTITMDEDKTVTATFEAVTYPLTITQPATGGSITATVDEISYTESTNVLENKTVTLTAVPAVGYQLAGWTNGTDALGDLPKSLVNTITMTEAKTATATFEAIPTVAGVTEESVWTFDGFGENTILSDKTVYGYNNGKGTLYISGHSTSGSITAAAKVVAGNMTEGQVVGTGEAVQPEKCLQLQGGGISSLAVSRTANSFTPDAIAFQAGVPGTVYVLMSGGYKTGETRSINIAANKSETDNTKKAIYSTTLTEGDPVQVVSCEIAEASSVFIGTSVGGKKIYAVKFVPAPTYTITKSTMTNGDVTIEPTSATAGQTVTLTVSPTEGYRLKSGTLKATYNDGEEKTLTITDNQFTMPAYSVTVTAEFEAVNPVGTWDFQSWAQAITEFSASTPNLERNTNGVLTGRIVNTATPLTYYNTKLAFNDVFGASTANVQLRKHNTATANGLMIGGGKSSDLTIYNIPANSSIKVTWNSSSANPISFPANTIKGVGSSDYATTVTSGTYYIYETGGNLTLSVTSESGNPTHINSIVIEEPYTITNATTDVGISAVTITKVNGEAVTGKTFSDLFAKGSTVTLKATYSATNKNLVWQDGDGNPLTANEDGTLTLTMDGDKTVKAVLMTGITVTEVKNTENKVIARKLDNGLIEVTIENNGRITAIKDLTTKKWVMTSTDVNQRGYFNFNYRPSQTEKVIDFGLECKSSDKIVQKGSSGDSQIELIYPMADADKKSHQTWKIGYVMKSGVSGIYTYTIMDGSSSYSELHEARYGWRVNPAIFTYAWVSDNVKGTMPTPEQMTSYTREVQDATYQLSNGTIYTKYDWANFVKDDQLHGIMGDGIGAWLISPSTEWVNGGPTKQELTVHATETTPIILQTMHSRHFGAAAAVLGSSDKKMFGPCLFYVNSGSSQEAMIEDAKAKATAEVNAWPYAWFTNNDDIKSGLALTAADRGSVTGTVNISGGFVTNKVQVVLTQGNKKPLLDGNGYQYYVEANVGDNFTIKNVRPGTYTLYVYALNGDATGTYKKENVTVNTGTNGLGTISWTPDKLGVTLWRIGEADRSTKGFKLSDQKRQYGLWDYVPTARTYTIGTSTEANDWYYAQVQNGGNWKINFNNTESYTKPLKLTIATAGAAQAPKLEVKLNDKLLHTKSYVFSNDAAIYRSGVLSGRDSLIVIDVPAAYMQVGQNTLNLKVNGLESGVGGIMYDCIKLEDGSDVSGVTYDFRTWAEAHLSKNGEDHQADIVRDGTGVLTGNFTPQTGETVDGTMTLNGKFSIVGNKTDKISSYKLRKRGTDQNAGSGLLFPRCGKGEADFIINNLNPGEWFTLDAHASYHLQFAEANANVTQLGRTETVTGTTEIIPGTVYKVKDDATGPVSVKICNVLSGGGQSFIYSVTISSGEAISEPTIGDLSDGKVTMTGGASTKGGMVKTFYTIDGSTPTSSSAEYTAAVAIDQTRIVKAVTINTTTGIASNVVTKKIKVNAATPATVWDFKNDATLKPLTYADEVYNGCYVNTSGQHKSDAKFKYVTNEKIHSKLSWQIEGSETANATVGNTGLAINKGGRAFAINDLHVGDKIYITYSNTGTTPLKTSICNESRGCAISVNGGATVTSGNTTSIASGDEIEIKSTPEGYEYLVLMPTDNKITITKIEINQHVIPEIVPSTPAVYDIAETVAKGDTLAFSQTGVSVYNMEKSGNNWELKRRSDFYPVTNFSNKVSVRVGSNSLTYNMTAGTMQLRRAMAIHDLSEGDEIVILYSGEGSLISVNSDRSDAFTVGGKTVAAGEEISSGATIKITKTQEDNNYIVVNTSGTVYLQAIYVNTKAPTMVIRPKIELTEVGTTTATYRITYEEGARLYYILAKEGEEHRVSTTGTYDFTIEESDRIKAWATRSGITSDTLSTVIYAPTPAPSESGDYDFFEQANELPADLEVTLDPSKQVTVGGQTLYKPTAMTAQTFNNKFAFTETNTTGKIKIRTNRTLVFNKGTNMNMALLNMKRGDIISFDYKGTITFANTSVIRKETSGVARARGMTRAESDELESCAAYVVQQDGDVLLNLALADNAIAIAKMYVASAPGKSKAAAIDFATAAEEEEELDQGGAAGVWCHEREVMIKFLRFTNQSDELPINNKVSSENGYGANSTNGFTSGNRNIAIHNLAKGDTIKVRFAGGAMMYYGHKSYGNRVSVNGQLLQPGDTIHSGDVLKVEQVDYLNNYVVLRIGSKAAISGIFINTLETEKVLMPTITPKSSNTFLITSGVSTVGNEVGSIYTLNGTDPSMFNGTGGPYESFEIQVVRGEEMTIKAMSYSSSGMVSRITTLYYNGSDLTPIESIKMDENGQADGETVIYDLQGRRVNDPRPGNIYIINGKKVVYKRR